MAADSLYTKAQPLQWYPDAYGGGLGHPILGDMMVEQTVTAVLDQPHTFKAHFRATHLNNDLHFTTGQEFPAVYTNLDYNRFVYYAGTSPWTSGATTTIFFPILGNPNPPLYVPELWGALVNSQNVGLTVYAPSQDPLFIGFQAPDPGPGGPTDNATNYFAPLGNLTIGRGLVFEGDVYLIAGDTTIARKIVYQLHQTVSAPDIFAPYEATDQPAQGSTVSGVTTVSGWAFDDRQVAKVEIIVDGVVDGIATYGSPRPDVRQVCPASPVNVGFTYSLNTAKYANGAHTLSVRVTDTSGNITLPPNEVITIAN